MPRKPKPPPEPRRRPRGGWSIDYRPERRGAAWRVRPPASVDPKRRATYHATEDDAQRYVAEGVERLAVAAEPSALTLGEWCWRWLRIAGDSSGWSVNTRFAYRTHVNYLRGLFDVPLTSVTRAQLQEAVASLTHTGVREFRQTDGSMARRPLTARSIGRAVGTWRRAFADAIEDDLLTKNPAARLRVPRVENVESDAWSAAEARRLVEVARGRRFEIVVSLIVGCALRIGEVLGLRWDDLDHQTRTILIRRSGTRKIVSQHTKSRRVRALTLPPPVWAALLRHREAQYPGAEYVLEHKPGQRWTYHTLRAALREMTAEAGIPPYAFHAGRHATATYLLASGVSEAEVARLLGHANPAVTQAIYHHAVRDSAEVAEVASGLFSGTENGPEIGE